MKKQVSEITPERLQTIAQLYRVNNIIAYSMIINYK